MEVYTISGPDVELLGSLTPQQATCAKQSAPVVIAGVGARVLSVPVALFGTYKLFKKSPAAGVTGLLVGVAMWLAGTRLVNAAEAAYERCLK
jgi:hypothetical protein